MAYLLSILCQILFLAMMAARFTKNGATQTVHYAICFLMGCVYAAEFVREVAILFGYVPEPGTLRLVILRAEHTIFGAYLYDIYLHSLKKRR